MSEDQARVTQCCGGEGCGYVNPDDNVRYCVASACMAWRWLPRTYEHRAGPVEVVSASRKPDDPSNSHHYWTAENPMAETWGRFEDVGFCGLAGRP